MKIKDIKGFTLIEMLVVVLIIGILAAIALPQYKKAVRKARVSEAKIILKALSDAQDRYFLSTGNFDYELEHLDIDVSKESNNWSFYRDECLDYGCGVGAMPKWEEGYDIEYWSNGYSIGDPMNGKFICYAYNNIGHNICKSLEGHILFGESEDRDARYQI